MTSPLQNPIDDLLPFLLQAVEAWKQRNTPQQLMQQVNSKLDKSRDEIILKLLGFNTSYSGWQLDHCNGRSGDSIAGEYLKRHQNAAIEDWLRRTVMPALSDDRRESILRSMEQQYEKYFRECLSKAITAQASKDAEAVMAQLTQSHSLDKYLKMLELIADEPNKVN